jgi:hypothetical protein
VKNPDRRLVPVVTAATAVAAAGADVVAAAAVAAAARGVDQPNFSRLGSAGRH